MTIFLPDVSNWNKGVDLSGTVAAIAKCSEGAGYQDPYYAGYRAQGAGKPFAAYHWVDTDDLAAQAANAHAMAGDVPVMWDAEAPGADVPRLLELTARYRDLGGVASLCYLPEWWWRYHLGAPDLTPLQAAGLALVSSYYVATYTDDGPGWRPYGGVTPSLWQWTSSHPTYGDYNAFKGTVGELANLFGGKVETGMIVVRDPTTGGIYLSNDQVDHSSGEPLPVLWHVHDPNKSDQYKLIYPFRELPLNLAYYSVDPANLEPPAGLPDHQHSLAGGVTGPVKP